MSSSSPVRPSFAPAIAILFVLLGAAGAAAGPVELISKADPVAAAKAMGTSSSASVSADGRYAAFSSTSSNLAAAQNDGNHVGDVFLRDRISGTVTLVSHNSASTSYTGNALSNQPRISADGNWVVFLSNATDLVAGQINSLGADVFLWERATGAITLVSHSASSAVTEGNGSVSPTPPAISADGAYVAFESTATNLAAGQTDANPFPDIFLYDRASGVTTLVSHANGSATTAGNSSSQGPDLSADGRYVVYTSVATDLVSGQTDTNNAPDVFLYDRTAGTSVLVSHANGPVATTAGDGFCLTPRISADGLWVAYTSSSTNLAAGQTGTQLSNVFLYSRAGGTSVLVSHASGSATTESNDESLTPSISADGSYVAFSSFSTDLVAGQTDGNDALDVFLYDRAAGTSALASGASGSATATAGGASTAPAISADGSRVAFTTLATNLLASESDTNGDFDVFLYDQTAATLELVSHKRLISLQGKPALPVFTGNGASTAPALSATGAYVAFTSLATDLTPQSDTNGGSDVFLYPGPGTDILPVSFSPPVISATANGLSSTIGNQALSGDGRYAVFYTLATNLIPGVTDANGSNGDIYLRDRIAGTTVLVSRSAAAATTTGNGLGSQDMEISTDGGYVAFESYSSDLVSGQGDPGPSFGDPDVFLFDRAAGMTLLVSHRPGFPSESAGGLSTNPVISADGAHVAFANVGGSVVPGLVVGNSGGDLFLYSRATGESILVSRTSSSPTTSGNGHSENPGLSADGRYVAFLSKASNLASGQVLGNSDYNAFLFDRIAGTTVLVSHAASSLTTTGDAGLPNASSSTYKPAVSADGSFVALVSRATNLVPGQVDTAGTEDVFLWERATGTITLVSRSSASAAAAGNGNSNWPTLSADGRYLAFTSFASNLVPGQVDTNGRTDVFLYDRLSGTTALVSHMAGSTTAAPASGLAQRGAVSADGTSVVFESSGANLVAGQIDLNASADAFLYDRLSGTTRLVSHRSDSPTTAANGASGGSCVSADGSTVFFVNVGSGVIADDYNEDWDVFVHSRAGLDYFTLPPCRLIDTRNPQDGPALASGATEVLTLPGACGIPATAKAVALNVTVLQATGAGHLTLFPGDFLLTPATSTINFRAGASRANNAIIPLAGDGAGTLAALAVVSGGGTVHVILDVVGYFE